MVSRMFNVRFVFPVGAKDEATVKIKGYWTKNGKKIEGSDFDGPKGANDVKRIFAALQFTKNGEPIGDLIPPPDGADDVKIECVTQKQKNEKRSKKEQES